MMVRSQNVLAKHWNLNKVTWERGPASKKKPSGQMSHYRGAVSVV
jgi:hypothetical protein